MEAAQVAPLLPRPGVAALSNPSPAIERQALEICINRLGGNPEDGVDLEDGEIVVALTAGEAVIGGGTYKHAPPWTLGVRPWLPRASRWRTSFLFHALEVAHKIGAAFLALKPFDKSAAEFWARRLFTNAVRLVCVAKTPAPPHCHF